MTARLGLCELCGTQQMVRPRMVAWRSLVLDPFENVDACENELECRARIAAKGEQWPILERGERRRSDGDGG